MVYTPADYFPPEIMLANPAVSAGTYVTRASTVKLEIMNGTSALTLSESLLPGPPFFLE